MLKGLREVEKKLKEKNISFFLRQGFPEKEILKFINTYNISILITDFDPLRIKRKWKEDVVKKVDVPVHEVDAHNIIPCRIVSPKQEYAAYTIRPKLFRLLPEFLKEFPVIKKHSFSWEDGMPVADWERLIKDIKVDTAVQEVTWLKPGETEAVKVMNDFLERKVKFYLEKRNDPNEDVQSNLSPYLHFGQISA